MVLAKRISKLEIFTNSSLSDLVQRSWFGENLQRSELFERNELDVMQQFVEVHEVFRIQTKFTSVCLSVIMVSSERFLMPTHYMLTHAATR